MTQKTIPILAVLIVLLGVACSSTIDSYEEYVKYLNQERNGLVQEHNKQGLRIKMKYLPTDFLVLNELRHETASITDASRKQLRKEYANSLTFLMTIGPGAGEDFDVTKIGVANYQEFSERIMTMTYALKTQIRLEGGGKQYHPDLAQLEELFGLQNKRNILLVFNLSEEEQGALFNQDFSVQYEDEIFHTGINQFLFRKAAIQNIPTINYQKI